MGMQRSPDLFPTTVPSTLSSLLMLINILYTADHRESKSYGVWCVAQV